MSHRAYGSRAYRTLRPLVLAQAGRRCEIRGPHCQVVATTVDHIVPLAAGGSNERANLRAACLRCNVELGHIQRWARITGRRSRRW